MSINEIFNNREIAILIWLILFAIYVFRIAKVRESFKGILKTLASIKIIMPLILLSIYVGIVAYYLSRIGLWNNSLVKDTIFWYFTAGLVTMYKYVTAQKGKIPVKELLLDNLKLIIILEFVMNTYTFNLWGEMLVVPFVTIVVSMNAFAEATKKDQQVTKFLGVLQSIIGLGLLVYVFYRAITEYEVLGTLDALRSFLLPILLSTAIIPFAYIMAAYSNYESLFIGFKLGRKRSKGFIYYCKLIIILKCGLSTRRIAKLVPLDLMHIQNKADVKEILLKVDSDTHHA